jgi:hypothetical protein
MIAPWNRQHRAVTPTAHDPPSRMIWTISESESTQSLVFMRRVAPSLPSSDATTTREKNIFLERAFREAFPSCHRLPLAVMTSLFISMLL